MYKLNVNIGQKRLFLKDLIKTLRTTDEETYIICQSLNDFNDVIDNEHCYFLTINNEHNYPTETIIKDLKNRIDDDFSKNIIIYDVEMFNINYEYHVNLLSHFLNNFMDISIYFSPLSQNRSFPFSIYFNLEKLNRMLVQNLENDRNVHVYSYNANSKISLINYKKRKTYNSLSLVLDGDDNYALNEVLLNLKNKKDLYEVLNTKYPDVFSNSLFKNNDFILLTTNNNLLKTNSMSISISKTSYKELLGYLKNFPNIYIEDISFLYTKTEKEVQQFWDIINNQENTYKNIFIHINKDTPHLKKIMENSNLKKRAYYIISYNK